LEKQREGVALVGEKDSITKMASRFGAEPARQGSN